MFSILHIAALRRRDKPAAPSTPGPYRLVAIDIDGTLLDSTGRMRPATVEAINAARACGVQVVLASARPPRGMRELYHALGLDAPLVSYNGAAIHHPLTGQWLRHRALAPGLVRQIVELAGSRSSRLSIGAEVFDRYCVHLPGRDALSAPSTAEPEDDADSDVERVELVTDVELFARPVTRLLLGMGSRRRVEVAQMLAHRFGGRVAVGITDRSAIQLVHPHADKSRALASLARSMGIDRRQVMAIGDAPNDVGMLRWAGLGVGIGTAYESVLAAADVVGPSSDEDGVAWAIETYILRTAP